jgi:two-component system OmpR family response regulator
LRLQGDFRNVFATFLSDNRGVRVLLVEDDHKLARLVSSVLSSEGMDVDVARDGEEGLEHILRDIYDVAVVDWMLPGRDGPSICRGARASRLSVAILMLTARGQLEDRVVGLDSGADDYLVKPFAFDELLARIRALARRNSGMAGADSWELRYEDLVMDLRAHTARRGDISVDLTPTEWRLLELLLRHAGQAMSRRQIVDYVWSYGDPVQLTQVDVFVSFLRHKLHCRGQRDLLSTVRGVGYRLG